GPTLGISSDGSRIVFGTAGPGGERLFGINSDGTGLHVVLGPYNFVSHAGISGDGKKVLYDVIPFPCCSTPNEAGVVNFDGTGKLALASGSTRYPIGYPGSDDTMQISADGSKLLLGSTSFLYDTSSGTVLQLASIGGFFSNDPPTLIYDGMFRVTMNGAATRFVYLAGDSNNINQLVTMDLDPSAAG